MREMLQELSRQASAFFDDAHKSLEDGNTTPYRTYSYDQDYWRDLPAELRARSEVITGAILKLCGEVSHAA